MEDKLLIAVVAAVGTLIGAIVGAIASLGGSYLNNRTAWKIKKESMLAERTEQHRKFQLETLLQLQDGIQRFGRLTSMLRADLFGAYLESGRWGEPPLPETMTAEHDEVGYLLAKLIERIAHDELRAELQTWIRLSRMVALAQSEEDANKWIAESGKRERALERKIGEALRAQYEAPNLT